MARKRTGTAVTPFVPTRRSKIADRLAKRRGLTSEYIADAAFGYRKLKNDIELGSILDKIKGDVNLVIEDGGDTKSLLKELCEQSNFYFDYETDLFHFHDQHDKGFIHFFRRPFTFADLEEESIEEKFPDDIEARALIRALYSILKKNQWNHIYQKRIIQASFSFPIALIGFAWPLIAPLISRTLNLNVFQGMVRYIPDLLVSVMSFVPFVLVLALYGFIADRIMRKLLEYVTGLFTEINGTSCHILSNDLTALNGALARTFTKLLVSDIVTSQARLEVVEKPDWPEKATRVFTLAMWIARRIEYLEKFWQLQMERLRVFEMISDEFGNMTSRVVAILVLALYGVGLACFYSWGGLADIASNMSMFVVATIVVWHLSRVSCRSRYSFNMNDIVHQGFQKKWQPFKSIGYYQRIAEQYGNGISALRFTLLRRDR